MSDRIAQLLREVDASIPPPGGAGDFIAAIDRRRIRRRRRRFVTSAATAGLVLAAGLVFLRPTHDPAPPAPVAVVPAMPAEATELREELKPQTLVELHELTIEKLDLRQTQRRGRQAALARGRDSSPRELRDRAALILIYDADESLRAHRRDDAVAMYRRAIELFPQSPWADVARERLNRS